MARFWLLCFFVLTFIACDSETLVFVEIIDWPADVATLKVGILLNDRPRQMITVPARTPGFAFALPSDASGGMILDAVGTDLRLAEVASAHLSGPIPEETDFALRTKLKLIPHCLLEYDSHALQGAKSVLAMWGSGPNDIWAVGDQSLAHWNGSSFTLTPAEQDFSGVWGSSANDVWLVSTDGSILHWNGSSFTLIHSDPASFLYGVWGSGPKDVWAVGWGGTILHWNGSSITRVPSGTSQALWSIWGSGPDDVWAVGRQGTTLHWNGIRWISIHSGSSYDLFDVWGSGPNDVWVVGGSTVLHWNGSVWALDHAYENGLYLRKVWGSSPRDVWAVSGDNIRHWNGISWSSIPIRRPPLLADDKPLHLFGIWGSGPNDVWLYGIDDAARRELRLFHVRCSLFP